jgi:hypothetical protein
VGVVHHHHDGQSVAPDSAKASGQLIDYGRPAVPRRHDHPRPRISARRLARLARGPSNAEKGLGAGEYAPDIRIAQTSGKACH